MNLKHVKTVLSPQDGESRITCMAWAQNNSKLAVCTSDRVILLYDDQGERRDKFATKPADPKFGKSSYVVKGIAFSGDGTKLAVGQTDNIVFVYKIGEAWNDKKSICNKFPLQSSVTCLAWPAGQPSIVFGQVDGKVRVANVKTNKCSTLYTADSYVVSLAVNATGTGFLSGHADGTIVRYFFENATDSDAPGKLAVHPSAPYALAWAISNTFIAAGCDKRIYAYNREGRITQQFDYSRDDDEREFTVAASNTSGQSVVVGSYDRLRVLNWSPRKANWDEGRAKTIQNLYTITALGWKPDGSRLLAGTLCGGVEMFDCCLRKVLYKSRFEINFVSLSQVVVKNLSAKKNFSMHSAYGYEIDDVRVLGQDRFIVAHTAETLIVGRLSDSVFSEVQWVTNGGDQERYTFELNDNVCGVYVGGELFLIEYGVNEVLSSVRTELVSTHLISVRINERKQAGVAQNKKLAYLLDLKTVTVLDLVTGSQLMQTYHDARIDWIELNETGFKLLLRDRKLRLYLHDIETGQKNCILSNCTYVQWVPGSDVVVAQSGSNLCIWYNIESPEKVTTHAIRGDVQGLERRDGKTTVLVSDGGAATTSYTLDEELIEFRTAIEDGNYYRAVAFLETLEMTPETDSMWRVLARLAIDNGNLLVAERSFAALGDASKSRYLRETIELAERYENENNLRRGDAMNYYQVRARVAMFNKNYKQAESIYLEENRIDEAIDMYRSLSMWNELLQLAEMKRLPELEQLRAAYFAWLTQTNQDDRAGELKERQGDHQQAISLYMKAGLPARAARLIVQHSHLVNDANLVNNVAAALIRDELYDKAGDLLEQSRNFQKALECYKKGRAFRRAIDLARNAFPQEVVRLEADWAAHLAAQKQYDAAINHFIEAGEMTKALDCAFNAHQWLKAEQILEVVDQNIASKYYKRLAQHSAQVGQYKTAEKYYLAVDEVRECVAMYNAAGLWEEAHTIAARFMKTDELTQMYSKQAEQLSQQGKLKDAERLYITMNKPDLAITMYKNSKMYEDVMRLVRAHFPQYVETTNLQIAKELETDGNYRQAEQRFIEAGDWKAVITMYKNKEMWEDAYRVAKSHGGPNVAMQVAYFWARSLGAALGVRVLNRFGLLDNGIEFATEKHDFEFAFELIAASQLKTKEPEVHLKFAMFLEDEGRFKEAEEHFLKASKAKEAILMYVHLQDWNSAQRLAEAHDPDSIKDVYIGQAKVAYEQKDFAKAESFLLRAQRPEAVVKLYREAGMWQDAMRVCQEYLPHRYPELQEEYEQEVLRKSNKGAEALLEQAQQWETNGDFQRAIECYARIGPQHSTDTRLLQKAWLRAGDLAIKHLEKQQCERLVKVICPRLVEIKQQNAAAELYLNADLISDAIDVYIDAEEFQKAKKVAKEFDPRLESYVDQKYKQYLERNERPEEMMNVDVLKGLEMLAKQGMWEKCLEMAEKQGMQVLHKYLAMYAAKLLQDQQVQKVLALYLKYGTPALQQNVNIYRRVFFDMCNMPGMNKSEAYPLWSQLRDFLYSLCTSLKGNTAMANVQPQFEQMLYVAHFYAVRSAVSGNQSLHEIAAKVSVSLLRYSDLIPVDKAFYEAGMACRSQGWDNMAAVFLNHYLDVTEAIEEGSADSLDNADIENTDIPLEVTLPERAYVNKTDHEEVKDWVLAVAMDRKVTRSLPKDDRGVYVASLLLPGSTVRGLPCVISGYPVLRNAIEFQNRMAANREDWNKFVTAAKVSRTPEMQDVLKFITSWCGASAAGYSF